MKTIKVGVEMKTIKVWVKLNDYELANALAHRVSNSERWIFVFSVFVDQ